MHHTSIMIYAILILLVYFLGNASFVLTITLKAEESIVISGTENYDINVNDNHEVILDEGNRWKETDIDDSSDSNTNRVNNSPNNDKNGFLIGTGIYDITGPIAEVNFMGYADPSQTGHGIHQRLRARAYIISERDESPIILSSNEYQANENVKDRSHDAFLDEWSVTNTAQSRKRAVLRRTEYKSRLNNVDEMHSRNRRDRSATIDSNRTICFVSVDLGMGSDWINHHVVKRLKELQNSSENETALQSIPCTLENLSISGSHTHSGPSGYLQYFLYQITSLGSNRASFDTVVNGIVQALIRANRNLQPGSIQSAHGLLLYGASINRSPSSYLLNPESERNKYIKDGGDTDKDMYQLNFRTDEEEPIGLISWFAVHCTSMNHSNTLVSGDNKGYASYLLEKFFNGNEAHPGSGKFVAAFASTNLGDVSPNILGARCVDTGGPCDKLTSSCNNGNPELCIASGPAETMKQSTEIIGRKQFDHSLKLWNLDWSSKSQFDTQNESCTDENDGLLDSMFLSGPVRFRHSFVDMSAVSVELKHPNGSASFFRTCPPALGCSFAAGTTDGPGDYRFHQGMNQSVSSTAFKQFLTMTTGLFSKPSAEQTECHHPKPILFDVGHLSTPYEWVQRIVPISIFQIGQLFLLNCPGEFTTMAGRRLRNAVHETIVSYGVQNPQIVIAGLSNSYTHYVTTYEEYQAQRYEAASTLYGPHTLSAYIQEFTRITNDLMLGVSSQTSALSSDLTSRQISLLPPVIVDTIGIGFSFGSVRSDAKDRYRVGDTVSVTFRSSNPRNNYKTEDTYLTVEKMNETDGTWIKIYVDGDWCTELHWNERSGKDLGSMLWYGQSFARIVWEIPPTTTTGIYRVCHFGTRKTIIGNVLYVLVNGIPLWMTANSVFTSRVADVIYQSLRMIMKYTGYQKKLNQDLIQTLRNSDFQGCSRSFLVHP